jgi:hypothetical protein
MLMLGKEEEEEEKEEEKEKGGIFDGHTSEKTMLCWVGTLKRGLPNC